jgi:hypothetical protein
MPEASVEEYWDMTAGRFVRSGGKPVQPSPEAEHWDPEARETGIEHDDEGKVDGRLILAVAAAMTALAGVGLTVGGIRSGDRDATYTGISLLASSGFFTAATIRN